ncbi:MAG: hypothetical protein KA054_02465 [Candidatus Moranbacteria bacterium]|nr:hypothetical protein [Candidatus Moranbacteria bacterium]
MVEVIVAIGIFSILLAMMSMVFGESIRIYRNTTYSQRYVENAQFTMNELIKQLRTSSVITPVGNPAVNTNPVSIRFFDHSQSKCIVYRQHLAPDYIERALGGASTAALCSTDPDLGDWERMTAGDVRMRLIIRNSVLNSRVGMVHVSFSVGGGNNVDINPILLQSAVSLRDYKRSFGL